MVLSVRVVAARDDPELITPGANDPRKRNVFFSAETGEVRTSCRDTLQRCYVACYVDSCQRLQHACSLRPIPGRENSRQETVNALKALRRKYTEEVLCMIVNQVTYRYLKFFQQTCALLFFCYAKGQGKSFSISETVSNALQSLHSKNM